MPDMVMMESLARRCKGIIDACQNGEQPRQSSKDLERSDTAGRVLTLAIASKGIDCKNMLASDSLTGRQKRVQEYERDDIGA